MKSTKSSFGFAIWLLKVLYLPIISLCTAYFATFDCALNIFFHNHSYITYLTIVFNEEGFYLMFLFTWTLTFSLFLSTFSLFSFFPSMHHIYFLTNNFYGGKSYEQAWFEKFSVQHSTSWQQANDGFSWNRQTESIILMTLLFLTKNPILWLRDGLNFWYLIFICTSASWNKRKYWC